MKSEENNVDQKDQDATEDDADALEGSLGPVVQQCEWQKHENQDKEKKNKSREGCDRKERQDRRTGEPGGRWTMLIFLCSKSFTSLNFVPQSFAKGCQI